MTIIGRIKFAWVVLVTCAMAMVVLPGCFTKTQFVYIRQPELADPAPLPTPPAIKDISLAEFTPFVPAVTPAVNAIDNIFKILAADMALQAQMKSDAAVAALKSIPASLAVEEQSKIARTTKIARKDIPPATLLAIKKLLKDAPPDAVAAYIAALLQDDIDVRFEFSLYQKFSKDTNKASGLYWSSDTAAKTTSK